MLNLSDCRVIHLGVLTCIKAQGWKVSATAAGEMLETEFLRTGLELSFVFQVQ